MIRHRPYAHHKIQLKAGSRLFKTATCRVVYARTECRYVNVSQPLFYFIIRYMPLPYDGLFADWRVLPPTSGCLGCTIRSCKYVCNTVRHRSVKNHRSNPFYISWTCLTVRPAFERYLKLRKYFHNSKSADSSKCFFLFDAVTTWNGSRRITTDIPKKAHCEPHGCFSAPLRDGAFRFYKARSGHGELSLGDTT